MFKLVFIFIFFGQILSLQAEDINIHAEVRGKSLNPIVFMIHGSPGSAESFSNILNDKDLAEKALLVAIDRPGYGKSKAMPGATNIEEQAKIFLQYLDKNYPGREVVLVGHSYGSAIAAKMAAMNSEKFKSVVLLSSMANPEEVKNDKKMKFLKMFSGITNSSVCKSILPNSATSCQTELLNFEDDVRGLLKDWEKISANVILIHGEEDKSISSKNADLAKLMIGNNSTDVHIIPEAGHHLLSENFDEIKEILLKELTPQYSSKCSSLMIPFLL